MGANPELRSPPAAAELRSAWTLRLRSGQAREGARPHTSGQKQQSSALSFPVTTQRICLETGVSMRDHCEPRTLCTQLDARTSPRGAGCGSNPVGFHFLKREWKSIPFISGREKSNFSLREAPPSSSIRIYLIEAVRFTAAEGSLQ